MRSQICCGSMEPRSAKALTPVHASAVIAERDGVVVRFASEEDLPAVRFAEAAGFDRAVPTVEYWRDLSRLDAASQPG
jgi:hypothetical protein